jgi:DNA-binding NarL/FixJ family response regulator
VTERELRVVLADDHYLVREGLLALLSPVPGLEVVAVVGDAVALLEVVAQHRPDAVLTDIRMPPGRATDGIDAALTIRAQSDATGVVVLSQHLEEAYVRALFSAGSSGLGYLLKERIGQRDDVVDALHRTARGESVLDRTVVDVLLAQPRVDRLAPLTDREREVLALMATGLTNPVIADRMHLSLSSVEKHVGSIFTKLDLGDDRSVHRRVAAVVAHLEQAGRR